MGVLADLVNLLTRFVDDAVPLAEAEISTFARENKILLRDDHMEFLARFNARQGERLGIFKSYGGDFDFSTFKGAYLDKQFPLEVPAGCAYFGTNFAGESFCIDFESGQIFQNDENRKGGLVHEGIDGFLLRCLILAYGADAFSSKEVRRNLDIDVINEFRTENQANKIAGADAFVGGFKNINEPKAFMEYYKIGDRLIYLFMPTRDMVIFKNEAVGNLT